LKKCYLLTNYSSLFKNSRLNLYKKAFSYKTIINRIQFNIFSIKYHTNWISFLLIQLILNCCCNLRKCHTNCVIRREILDGDSALCSGAYGKETLSHLFFDCNFFGAVWYEEANWLSFSFVPPRDAIARILQFGGSLISGHDVRNILFVFLIWATCCWSVLKEQNN
jgi:hypothetical protein